MGSWQEVSGAVSRFVSQCYLSLCSHWWGSGSADRGCGSHCAPWPRAPSGQPHSWSVCSHCSCCSCPCGPGCPAWLSASSQSYHFWCILASRTGSRDTRGILPRGRPQWRERTWCWRTACCCPGRSWTPGPPASGASQTWARQFLRNLIFSCLFSTPSWR